MAVSPPSGANRNERLRSKFMMNRTAESQSRHSLSKKMIGCTTFILPRETGLVKSGQSRLNRKAALAKAKIEVMVIAARTSRTEMGVRPTSMTERAGSSGS